MAARYGANHLLRIKVKYATLFASMFQNYARQNLTSIHVKQRLIVDVYCRYIST